MDLTLDSDAILAQIESESLQSLLASVRHQAPFASTRVRALDAYIASIRQPHAPLDPPLYGGDVLEVQGPAATGKTHFVYLMLLNCLLPVDLGGWGKAAILFDVDLKFDIRRFHELLLARIAQTEPTEANELATRCLRSLHIFRPMSTVQLAVTILHLPRYHSTNPRMQEQEIGLLAIDSLSAFYWKDRWEVEQIHEADSRDTGPPKHQPPSSSSNPLAHALHALQLFRLSHRPLILLTNWGLNTYGRFGTDAIPPFFRQHLHPFPSPFDAAENGYSPLPVHYHITLHPVLRAPFPSSCTLDEAAEVERDGTEQAKPGRMQGLVRCPGETRVGEFMFRITADAIETDEERPLGDDT